VYFVKKFHFDHLCKEMDPKDIYIYCGINRIIDGIY